MNAYWIYVVNNQLGILHNAAIIVSPTMTPAMTPTMAPTMTHTKNPTMAPTMTHTKNPTMAPSMTPTKTPTMTPTQTTRARHFSCHIKGNLGFTQLCIVSTWLEYANSHVVYLSSMLPAPRYLPATLTQRMSPGRHLSYPNSVLNSNDRVGVEFSIYSVLRGDPETSQQTALATSAGKRG